MQETAILLINLGSPAGTDTKQLKYYLEEFLMDERVIDVPKWWRSILVKGIIVPFRAAKSAEKYKTIWTEQGSPLVTHTKEQCRLLQERSDIPVYYSMRYGAPSAMDTLKKIHTENPSLQEIIVFPLYPHYAMSSYETAIENVREAHRSIRSTVELKVIPPFFDHPDYIQALANSIRPYVTEPFDHLLFSYHGIPERHVKKTDCTGTHCLQASGCCDISSAAHDFCYRHQVITTTNKTAALLGLNSHQYSFSFQSRLGRDAWLKPYTGKLFETMPAMGIKKLLIVCPAFVSDCLETLEEIAVEGKTEFLKHGGIDFQMIPALNENNEWIDCMCKLIEERMKTAVA
jgi:ferrochelatase